MNTVVLGFVACQKCQEHEIIHRDTVLCPPCAQNQLTIITYGRILGKVRNLVDYDISYPTLG